MIYQSFFLPDIDECHEKPDICRHGSICTNLPGNYPCPCKEGYEDDEGVCLTVTTPFLGKL